MLALRSPLGVMHEDGLGMRFHHAMVQNANGKGKEMYNEPYDHLMAQTIQVTPYKPSRAMIEITKMYTKSLNVDR